MVKYLKESSDIFKDIVKLADDNRINENLPSKEVISSNTSSFQNLQITVEDEKSEDNSILHDDNKIDKKDPITVTNGHIWNFLSLIKNDQQHELPKLLAILKDLETSLGLIQQKISFIKDETDSIYKRWCSEQKLIHFLRKGEFPPGDESTKDVRWKKDITKIANDKTIKNCFLLIHSYQNPCVCCRLSSVRAHKVFLKDELQKILGPDIPFHIVVSYRQPYSNTIFKDFESVKEIQEPLGITEGAPLLSLYQINPENERN